MCDWYCWAIIGLVALAQNRLEWKLLSFLLWAFGQRTLPCIVTMKEIVAWNIALVLNRLVVYAAGSRSSRYAVMCLRITCKWRTYRSLSSRHNCIMLETFYYMHRRCTESAALRAVDAVAIAKITCPFIKWNDYGKTKRNNPQDRHISIFFKRTVLLIFLLKIIIIIIIECFGWNCWHTRTKKIKLSKKNSAVTSVHSSGYSAVNKPIMQIGWHWNRWMTT